EYGVVGVGVPGRGAGGRGIDSRYPIAWLTADVGEESARVNCRSADSDRQHGVVGVRIPRRGIAGCGIEGGDDVLCLTADVAEQPARVQGRAVEGESRNHPVGARIPRRYREVRQDVGETGPSHDAYAGKVSADIPAPLAIRHHRIDETVDLGKGN